VQYRLPAVLLSKPMSNFDYVGSIELPSSPLDLEHRPIVDRIQQNHLVPAMFDPKLFTVQLAITIITVTQIMSSSISFTMVQISRPFPGALPWRRPREALGIWPSSRS
jgi:hypothetical protein